MLAETKLFSFFRPKIQRLLQAFEVVWVIIFRIGLQAFLRILVFSWLGSNIHVTLYSCLLQEGEGEEAEEEEEGEGEEGE